MESLGPILISVGLAGTNEEAAPDWLQRAVKRACLGMEKEQSKGIMFIIICFFFNAGTPQRRLLSIICHWFG